MVRDLNQRGWFPSKQSPQQRAATSSWRQFRAGCWQEGEGGKEVEGCVCADSSGRLLIEPMWSQLQRASVSELVLIHVSCVLMRVHNCACDLSVFVQCVCFQITAAHS